MDLLNEKPRVLIIGLGAYFKKLRKGIARYFEIAQLIDSNPFEALDLMTSDYAKFQQLPVDLYGLKIDEPIDCIMLLTPPAFHVPYIHNLARYKKTIFVEKPVTTSSIEIPRLEKAVRENTLIYCSDFYPDVRATPLLIWAKRGMSSPLKPLVKLLKGDIRLWNLGVAGLGPIERVSGKLLEGTGSSRSFEGRWWLWDPSQGGVLLDLMYHYITVSSYLLNKELILEKAVLETKLENGEMIPWHPSLRIAETYAYVEGRFSSGIPFTFEVAKYWAKTERYFTLHCSSGTASMIFNDPNILSIESDQQCCEMFLKGNHYEHVALCFFDYLSKGQEKEHGLYNGLHAVRVIDMIKKIAGH